jgi:hypothetical protein
MKLISCELQNISGNTVIKVKSVVIFINITINIILLLVVVVVLQSPQGARAFTAISQMRPNIYKRWTALRPFAALSRLLLPHFVN